MLGIVKSEISLSEKIEWEILGYNDGYIYKVPF